jgi:Ner family transcriptional regulator
MPYEGSSMFKPRKTKWDRPAIKAEIARRGFNQGGLSKHLGMEEQMVRLALRQPYEKVNRKIAAFLGVPVQDLWPDWFDEDGDLLPPKFRAKLSRLRAESASRELQAAGD